MDLRTATIKLQALTLRSSADRLRKVSRASLMGVQGPQGPVGPKGDQGPKGDTGAQGETGAQGAQGPMGLVGTQGADGANGEQGSIGPMPKHQNRGDAVRFELEEGVWGKWINLGTSQPVGGIGKDTVVQLINELGGTDVYDKLIDTVGDVKYIGEAAPGSTQSEAKWRIKKVDLSDAGGDIEIVFANGTSTFDKVWADRLTYTYTVAA